jgi:hypothetical protein
VDPERFPAAGIVTIVTALARALVQDSALGVPDGYAEALKLTERPMRREAHWTVTATGGRARPKAANEQQC